MFTLGDFLDMVNNRIHSNYVDYCRKVKIVIHNEAKCIYNDRIGALKDFIMSNGTLKYESIITYNVLSYIVVAIIPDPDDKRHTDDWNKDLLISVISKK